MPPTATTLTLSQIDPAAWERLFVAAPGATPFHNLGWLAALSDTYPSVRAGAIVIAEGSKYLGGFPFALEKRKKLIPVVTSLPFGTYGGPLVRGDAAPDVLPALWEAFGRVFRRRRALSATVIDYFGMSRPQLHGFTERLGFTHRIALDADYEYVRRKVYSQNIRKNVRQSKERGVRVALVDDESGVRAYAKIATHTLTRRGTRPFPEELFLNIYRRMGERSLFHLAYHEDEPVAGVVHLVGAESVMNWLTSSYKEAWSLRPNNALVDGTIRLAIERGIPWYNFGGSDENDLNLIRYKESWGAERYDYRVWRHEAGILRFARKTLARKG